MAAIISASRFSWGGERMRRPRRKTSRGLLANLVDRHRRDPITIINARRPLHPVPAAAQDRDDLTLDVLRALAQHDDITGSRLRRRRWRRLRLGHEQCLS